MKFSQGKCFLFDNLFCNLKRLLLVTYLIGWQVLQAQITFPLTDLSAFQAPNSSWRLAGNVHADLKRDNVLTTVAGTGIVVNLPFKKYESKDLFTLFQHGDADVELDYMMAKGSNSGLYLQGRYEIQFLDSWGVIKPGPGDNGGIYERWNDSKPEGQKGYEGHAPRQNASRAPGLWQHLKISFQAPRFNGVRKIENARILLVELNGVPIQENVELSGPTRSTMGEDEVTSGPLRIQGDHGAVAFRNIRLTNYDKPRPELVDLKYTLYKGKFEDEPDYKKLPPEAEGTSVVLSSNIGNLANEFLIHYTGILRVKEPGNYAFNLSVPGGKGTMRINNKVVVPIGGEKGTGTVSLPAGDLSFELFYSKFVDFAKPALGLAVAGPGMREYVISDANISSNDPVNPILINAPLNTTLRSFIDLYDSIRVTHAVNVGSAQQVHYTYDMDNGMIVQVWRGGFLDATPMWHSRGDGSSRPAGMVQRFGKPVPAIKNLNAPDVAWTADTTGSGYQPKGYVLDVAKRPVFRYLIYNTMVTDASRVLENGVGIYREITLQNSVNNLFFRLAQARDIEVLSDGLYLLDDKSYYIHIEETGGATPVIRNATGGKELLIPIQSKISYSILF